MTKYDELEENELCIEFVGGPIIEWKITSKRRSVVETVFELTEEAKQRLALQQSFKRNK